MDPEKNPELLVAAGGTAGILISKLLSWIVKRHLSEGAEIRKELRDEVRRLTEKIDQLNKHLDEWKDRFYRITEENVSLRSEINLLKVDVCRVEQRQAGTT